MYWIHTQILVFEYFSNASLVLVIAISISKHQIRCEADLYYTIH